MSWNEFVPFVELAFEKDTEDKLHRQWSAMLPFMSMKMLEFKSFKDYSDACLGKNIDTRPINVIMDEIDRLQERMKRNKKGE